MILFHSKSLTIENSEETVLTQQLILSETRNYFTFNFWYSLAIRSCSAKSAKNFKINSKKVAWIAMLSLFFATSVEAGCEIDVSDYVGWGIIYSGTVTGYINDSGEEENDFEGCDWDRILILDYTKQVTCAEYSYSYAYRPDIVLISNGNRLKACINNTMFDVRW